MFYISIGPELGWYHVDVGAATIEKMGAVMLPAVVQYAWPHANRRYLYIVCSDGGPGPKPGSRHYLAAYRVDARTGALSQHGAMHSLPSRPIHVSLDNDGKYILTAFSLPSAASVHRINADGTVGERAPQPPDFNAGSYAHQIRVTPSNRTVLLPTRGHDAEGTTGEIPGDLKVLSFQNGILRNLQSFAPNGGFGYGPRHVDFHPTKPLVYVSVERQNLLQTLQLQNDGTLGAEPLFEANTLIDRARMRPRQMAGAVHVHPNGKTVYVSNRTYLSGGEDNIAVFSIDPASGEPTLIQHADPHGVHVRTFSFDATGRCLISASVRIANTEAANRPPALSLFRVAEDGRLDFVRKFDMETGSFEMFWSGHV